MSRFGLAFVRVACIVISLYVSLTVGCVKNGTTIIRVLIPPKLHVVNQLNYGFNMATVIAFQADLDSCVSPSIILGATTVVSLL